MMPCYMAHSTAHYRRLTRRQQRVLMSDKMPMLRDARAIKSERERRYTMSDESARDIEAGAVMFDIAIYARGVCADECCVYVLIRERECARFMSDRRGFYAFTSAYADADVIKDYVAFSPMPPTPR